MKPTRRITVIPALLVLLVTALRGDDGAATLLADKDVRPGLVVHLDCGDGTFTAELGVQPNAKLVQALSSSRESVEKARQLIAGKGLYGKVSADTFAGDRLPYPDNTVDTLVVQNIASLEKNGLTLKELLRVTAPFGVIWIEGADEKSITEELRPLDVKGMSVTTRDTWVKVTKPFPSDMDDWPQSLHDAGGTQMSQDRTVGPVRGVRWMDGYDWGDWVGEMRLSLVAGGRYFQYHAGEPVVFLPAEQRAGVRGNTWPELVARDAFNGMVLWRRPMGGGKAGLVYGDGLLYVTGLNEKPKGKLIALDPATGKTVRVLEDIKFQGLGWDENVKPLQVDFQTLRYSIGLSAASMMRYADGVLLVPNGDGGCRAWDLKSQKLLWEQAAPPVANWLGLGGMWFFHDADEAVLVAGQNAFLISADARNLLCRDLHTGSVHWESALQSPAERLYFATAGIVFTRVNSPRPLDPKIPSPLANGEKHTLRARDAATGKILWSFEYQGEAIGGGGIDEVGLYGSAVWVMAYRPKPMYVALDAATGKETKAISVSKEFQPKYCCPANLTCNWIITHADAFFNPLTGEAHTNHNVAHPQCGTGELPACGLMYGSSNCCRCTRMIRTGALALSSDDPPEPPAAASRLEKGPAFGRAISVAAAAGDWPMYRHDPARTGSTVVETAAAPKAFWTATLDGRPTQPVITDGKVYTAIPERHSVCCLDGKTGELLWTYRAGARIDSSPTWFGGKLFFGSRDGWIYCLAADDGRLVWRFQAAPGDRRIVVNGQLESAWPAHGSLIADAKAVYACVGRQTQLDGGLQFYALDPVTGEALWSSRLAHLEHFETTSDLMLGDGEQLFMGNDQVEGKRYQYTRLDPQTGQVRRLQWSETDQRAPHDSSDILLSSMMGFFCQRAYGEYGKSGGMYRRHFYYHQTIVGDLLSMDGARAWGFIEFPQNAGWGFYGDAKNPFMHGSWVFCAGGTTPWKQQIRPDSVWMKALVRAGGKVFVASQPDEKPDTGKITVFDADSGNIQGEIPLPGAPCFDGLSAAGGRFYLSCENGTLACYGE